MLAKLVGMIVKFFKYVHFFFVLGIISLWDFLPG